MPTLRSRTARRGIGTAGSMARCQENRRNERTRLQKPDATIAMATRLEAVLRSAASRWTGGRDRVGRFSGEIAWLFRFRTEASHWSAVVPSTLALHDANHKFHDCPRLSVVIRDTHQRSTATQCRCSRWMSEACTLVT
jgi:hypothetical protein